MPTPLRLVAALMDVSGLTQEDVAATIPDPKDRMDEGDSKFYTYFVPGAVYEAKDGSIWDIENISDTGFVRIRNKWYPRQELTLHQSVIRQKIHAWIEPVQMTVPPAPEPALPDMGVTR